MTLSEIAALLGWNLALILAVMLGLWGLSLRLKRMGFIEGTWPLAIAALAAATFFLTEGDPVRKGLLLWLVAVWAAPQAWRRLSPGARAEADDRYARATADRVRQRGWSPARIWLLLYFLPQGALVWLTALPVQLGQAAFAPPVGWIGWTGATLAVLGIGLEGLGSLRIAGLGTAPAVEDETVLRRWLRRPDRLGDLAVWWGLFLIAAETVPGRWSVMGPLLMTFLFVHWARTENPRRMRDGG